jgi:hypothetical protein
LPDVSGEGWDNTENTWGHAVLSNPEMVWRMDATDEFNSGSDNNDEDADDKDEDGPGARQSSKNVRRVVEVEAVVAVVIWIMGEVDVGVELNSPASM